tara:strand:- start:143 stop:613 length:471 start_codon:yes stop_codon:yes gene_type:complete
MKIIGLNMEKKIKNEPAFRGWVNRTGRLAGSTGYNFAFIDGKPSILLQSGGQFRGEDVFYARLLEFGSQAMPIKIPRHNVKKHRVGSHSITNKHGTTYQRKAHSRSGHSRGPYDYIRPPRKGKFYLKRTVEWGTQQFPKDLREVVTFALAGKTINV